jgi:hypothetical protein
MAVFEELGRNVLASTEVEQVQALLRDFKSKMEYVP